MSITITELDASGMRPSQPLSPTNLRAVHQNERHLRKFDPTADPADIEMFAIESADAAARTIIELLRADVAAHHEVVASLVVADVPELAAYRPSEDPSASPLAPNAPNAALAGG